MKKIDVVQADYLNPQHAKDIPYLLNEYACDPMGGAHPLSPETAKHLVSALSKRPHAFSVLIYVDGLPAALANCFEGFSTFACKPLINIHDLCVIKDYRGLGLSQLLLEKIESIAIDLGCCKVTLEVLSNNHVAKAAYEKFGFHAYELDPSAGRAVLWQKKLA
ncbi:GNAT family N-acetyltransferase [Marinomonas sp. THO17]|uniref:GNAT family N-acetyltransferase n=1 Tax=Marinomonas sp. THO17 TaxID=3149048 RepID=UPI00336BD523